MRAAGTDAVGVLRWGLRRYRLLFLACLLLCGAVAPLAALRLVPPSDAEAVVIANRLDIDLVALPRYGEAVFNNGQVALAVAARFGDPGDSRDVVPDRVSLVADQNSIVFKVVGHDTDPKTAADIANVAADTFIQALNAGGSTVGTFALQSPAEPPAKPDQRLNRMIAIGVGLAAGMVLGLAAVSALLVVRRPVIDGPDAEEVTGVPALGTVVVPRVRHDRFVPPEKFKGLVPVCRRLLSLPTPTVVLVSRRRDQRARRSLTVALAIVLRRVREVHFIGPTEMLDLVEGAEPAEPSDPNTRSGLRGARPPAVTLVDSGEPLDLVQPPAQTATVLVVREGISSASLRAAVVEHLGGSAEARLLLVRRGRRSRSVLTPPAPGKEQAPARKAVAAVDTP